MNPPTPSATEDASRTGTGSVTLGDRLGEAIATRDRAGLRALFSTPVRFTAVTPRRFWDAETPPEVEDIVFGDWFDETKTVTAVQPLDGGVLGARGALARFGYRLSVETANGPTVIEQVGYYRTTDGRISDLRLVCSGFVRV